MLASRPYGLPAGLSSGLGAEWFGEGLGIGERRVQPLPPPWLESLIQEVLSCPAVLGCGSIWGPPAKLATVIPGKETTASPIT